MFIFLVTFVSAQQRCLDVGFDEPEIVAYFDEPTFGQISATLDNPIKQYVLNYQKQGTRHYYEPIDLPLNETRYTFGITAEDFFGNLHKTEVCFNLRVSPMVFQVNSPTYGVSNTQNFLLEIETDRAANCSYKDSDLGYQFMIPFTDDLVYHRVNGFNLSVSPTTYYVRCVKDGAVHGPFAFNLSVDTTPPVIAGFDVIPSQTIAGIPTVVEFPLIVEAAVLTDDLTRCKYDLNNLPYNQMVNYFNDYGGSGIGIPTENFLSSNTKTFSGLLDGVTYIYYVACENRAGDVSSTEELKFRVNLSASETASFVKPVRFLASGSNVGLELHTNKFSNCIYADNLGFTGAEAFLPYGQKVHTANIKNTLTENTYIYYALCYFSLPGGATSNVTTSVTFTIDSTPPTMVNVSQKPSCDPTEIEAEWYATDAVSGIGGYSYRVDRAGQIYVNWTNTTSNSATFKVGNDTTINYKVTVKAMDGAGNEGSILTSNNMNVPDPTDPFCRETDPPTINLRLRPVGNEIEVSINCSDTGSGCDPQSYKYGISNSTSCTASNSYSSVVLMLMETVSLIIMISALTRQAVSRLISVAVLIHKKMMMVTALITLLIVVLILLLVLMWM